jgi:prevent-host-death family protein
MREIGIRELKASLSETLAAVASGEAVRVTSHGKPVADLIPPQADAAKAHFHLLVAAGKVSPAKRPKPTKAPKPKKAKNGVNAGDLIIREREAGR